MVASQLSTCHRVAHDTCHDVALMESMVPHGTDNVMENIHEISQATTSRTAAPSNPFAFYRTYHDPNTQLLADQVHLQPGDDGYTRSPKTAVAHSVAVNDARPQAPAHAAAHKLATRLENRSNGAPLATIIEQGSYSTLNSHGSMLSVGRFHSTKVAETILPICESRRRSRSLDSKALHDIQEDLIREFDTFATIVPQARLDWDHGAAGPACGTATPSTSHRFETQRSASTDSIDQAFDQDDHKVKGFIRGVLQNMRGVSRARSRSSSLSYAPIVEHRDSPHTTSRSKLYSGPLNQIARATHSPKKDRSASESSSKGAAILVATEDQTRSRITPPQSMELSACVSSSQKTSRSNVTKSGHGSGSLPSVFPHQTATCARERPFSTPVVHAETRYVAPKDGTSQVEAPYHDICDGSAQYIFNSVPTHQDPYLHKETDNARDVFTNQNHSFCSTMSTSYSGTVLGIDLDLQHEFTCPTHRSQSPAWFTPQMAELERQAFLSESPESEKVYAGRQAPCHSITSSALTSLLPIAAATGIVQPNYNTPTISFYSPSGNLIQPESSPSQSTSSSDYSGSPAVTTSHYTRQNSSVTKAARTGHTQPQLFPMTTPSTQKASLPLHLQQHHNCRYPMACQVSSQKSYVTWKEPVKGCDGMVREDSLTPRSGFSFSHGKDKTQRSTRLVIQDLKAEVKFYKARLLAKAATQSFVPSIPKAKTTKQHRSHIYDAYAKKSHVKETKENSFDALGLLAAHALRACFCQPYDGAEISTHVAAVRACMTHKPFAEHGKMKADQRLKDVERLLPNARDMSSSRCSGCGNTKNSNWQGSASNSTSRRASYTGTAKLSTYR